MALRQPLHDDERAAAEASPRLASPRGGHASDGQGESTAARLAGRIRTFSEDKARSLREGLANLKRRMSGAANAGRSADGLYEPLTLNDPSLEDEQPRQAQAQTRVVSLSRAQLPDGGRQTPNAQLSADLSASEEAQLAAAIAASLDDAAIAQGMVAPPPEPTQDPAQRGNLAGPPLETLRDASDCGREAAQLLWEVTLEVTSEPQWRTECYEMCKLTSRELARILASDIAAAAPEDELAHALETLDALHSAMEEHGGLKKPTPKSTDALPPGAGEVAAAAKAPPPPPASATPLLDLLDAPVPAPLPPPAAPVPLNDGLAGLSLLDAPAAPSTSAAPAPARDKGKAPAVDVLATGHPAPNAGGLALGTPAAAAVPAAPAAGAPHAPPSVWDQLESLTFDAPPPAAPGTNP